MPTLRPTEPVGPPTPVLGALVPLLVAPPDAPPVVREPPEFFEVVIDVPPEPDFPVVAPDCALFSPPSASEAYAVLLFAPAPPLPLAPPLLLGAVEALLPPTSVADSSRLAWLGESLPQPENAVAAPHKHKLETNAFRFRMVDSSPDYWHAPGLRSVAVLDRLQCIPGASEERTPAGDVE